MCVACNRTIKLVAPTFDDLTPAQQQAVTKWEVANNDDGQFEYADNHRYAVEGNEEHAVTYAIAVRNGCCGSMDTRLTCDDGTVLLYGFNYGH